ncbi:MAG: prepilin-type N-terminal cleavage/methylation domain-containing protein [bacterium]|nr:prepilin-type N-terminal cleavage/methylation domain-containing protein [bacterium]
MKFVLARGGRCRGVTLLEIVIAAAILAVGLGTCLQVFPMGYAAATKAKNGTVAYELASKRLEIARSYALFGQSGKTGVDSSFGNALAPNPDGNYKEVNTGGQFVACGSSSPENRFFYRVDCLPVVDSQRLYKEYPYSKPETRSNYRMKVAGTTGDLDANTSGELAVDVATGNGQEGFASMYRITVTVRGPLLKAEQASDANWGSYSSGASEAVLSTMVANTYLGDALLAQDIRVTRDGSQFREIHEVPYKSGDRDKIFRHNYTYLYSRTMAFRDARYHDLNKLWVKPISGKMHPENFSVLEPAQLSVVELADTGPSVIGCMDPTNWEWINNESQSGVGSGEFGGLTNAFGATKNTKKVACLNRRAFVSNSNTSYYHNIYYIDKDSVTDSIMGEEKTNKWRGFNPGNSDGGEYGNGYGGNNEWGEFSQRCRETNMLGLDNIIIYCPARKTTLPESECNSVGVGKVKVDSNYKHKGSSKSDSPTYENGGWIAESNKLVRMYPPKSANNSSDYWCFELLNDVMARDCDYAGKYGPYLMDKVFDGDSFLDGEGKQVGYPKGGVSGGSNITITGTRVRSLVNVEAGRFYFY